MEDAQEQMIRTDLREYVLVAHKQRGDLKSMGCGYEVEIRCSQGGVKCAWVGDEQEKFLYYGQEGEFKRNSEMKKKTRN